MLKLSFAALLTVFAHTSSAVSYDPAHVAGDSYAPGAKISAPKTTETTMLVDCVTGISNCPTSGKKTLTTTSIVTYNYACATSQNSAFCGQSAFAPGSLYSAKAWTKEITPCTVSKLSCFLFSVSLFPPA